MAFWACLRTGKCSSVKLNLWWGLFWCSNFTSRVE
jgi:hypothetical protein